MNECSWSEFVECLVGLWEPRRADERTKKFHTPVISPAVYEEGARRANENVLGWGGWIGLDIDNDGPSYTSFQAAVRVVEDLALNAVIYTTTKATDLCHRFRVLLLLDRELALNEITPAWTAVCRMFAALGPDLSCKDLSRIYTVPTIWTAALDGNAHPISLNYCEVNGSALDIDWVLASYPGPPTEAEPTEAPAFVRCSTSKADAPPSCRVRASIKFAPSGGLYSNPLVTGAMIEEYVNAPRGSHHVGLYRFMTRVAGRAAARGYSVSADDLITLARELDLISPIKTSSNRWARIRSEAERALRFANSAK